MKLLILAITALVSTSCSKSTEIVFHPFVYSTDPSGIAHPDTQAVVVVSTFGGIPYNIHDYVILPVWPKKSATNSSLRFPSLRISAIHGNGGYHVTAISNDSLIGSDTFRESWVERLIWPSGDSISATTLLEPKTLLDLIESYTQGPSNRERFFSKEMRPFLLTLRRRACKIQASEVPVEWQERWNSANKLLSASDSCSRDTRSGHR